jgi:pseudouridine kinase
LLRQARATGVDVEDVLIVHNQPTNTYLAVVNTEGELQFALDDMRTIRSVTAAYIKKNAEWFNQASIVFLDANLSKEALRAVFSLAGKAGVPVCADPAAAGLAQRLIPYLRRLHLVTPNGAEAGVLCGWPFPVSDTGQAADAAKCLVSQGVEIAIITMAEFGVCYATSETSGHIPALRTEILDPTGAGNALTATVIFALINQIPLDDAVRLGVSAASYTLASPGTVAPDLSLEKLYDRLII